MLRLARNLLLTTAALGLLAVLAGFPLFVERIEREEQERATPVEGIVVLTGGSERIADAMDLLAKGRGRRLLITGVNEKTTKEEIVRRRPDLRPFFACCVDLDYQALNTIGNARQTRDWARAHGFASLLVVTSTYHMPRTLMEIAHALPDASLVPYPVVSPQLDLDRWWRDPVTAKLLALEYVKFIAATTRIALGLAQNEPAPPRTAANPTRS